MVLAKLKTRSLLFNRRADCTKYTYDAAGQVTDDGVTSYTYDNVGNRTNSSQSYGTGNRLSSDSLGTYTYDDEGNLVSRTISGAVWNYSYDNENRLTSVTKTVSGSVTYQVDYQYDVFGNRIQATTDADGAGSGSSVTERYTYDGENLWADLNGSSVVQVYTRMATRSMRCCADRWAVRRGGT